MSAAPFEALHRGRARIIASTIQHATPFSQIQHLSSLLPVFAQTIFSSPSLKHLHPRGSVLFWGASVRCQPFLLLNPGVFMDTLARIKDQIESTPVLLYMKGTPDFPQCGFSAKAVACLKEVGEPFAYVNILQDPEIRAELPKYANWPTFPQLWVKGELIGGCDIITEMHQAGELAPLLSDIEWPDET